MNCLLKKWSLLFFLGYTLVSCDAEESCAACKECIIFQYPNENESMIEALQHVKNDSTFHNTNQKDLEKSLVVIKEKYGYQWDFCDCIVKGDSLNKALTKPNLSDKELDGLLKRFDEIDTKCQAFKIVDPNRTPKERALHEKKVKKCLKEAGIN
jgi:hypothetical protein